MPSCKVTEIPTTKLFFCLMAPLTFFLASLPQTSQAGFTFQFVSTAGVREAEIVIELPATDKAAIQSLTILPTNDLFIPAGPVTVATFRGLLILDETETALISGTLLNLSDLVGTIPRVTFNNAFGQGAAFTWYSPHLSYDDYVETFNFPDPLSRGARLGNWELTSASPVTASPVPEPSPLVMLSTLTFTALGIVCYRKRRNRPMTAA